MVGGTAALLMTKPLECIHSRPSRHSHTHTLREWPAGNISAASRVFQHGHTRSRKVAVTTETPSGMFSISQMDDILLILIDVSFFSV